MTEADKDQKIEAIRNDESASPEFKEKRINVVEHAFANQQAQTEDAAKKKQQAAEANLRSKLKESFLKNPVATTDDFDRDYPALRSEYLKLSALRDLENAATSQERLTRNNF